MGAEHATPSLVRGSKSSTAFLSDEEFDLCNHWIADVAAHERKQRGDFPQGMMDDASYPSLYQELEENEEEAGKYIKLQMEAWRAVEQTQEGAYFTPLDPEKALWRATAYTETRGKNRPPPQNGDRWTERLSDRGKKKIENASLYMHKTGRGFRTFLTLTFTSEHRAMLEKWDQQSRKEKDRGSIGKSVTEFLNVLQQRHRNGLTFKGHYRRSGKQQKGGAYDAHCKKIKGKVEAWCQSSRWTPIKWREDFHIAPHKQPFQYVWVAESPKNEKGENNPHIHILLNWHVKLDQFHAWARWIENAWGKGFAKLERIKKPAAAASYMAKAANYISKGSNGEQGAIRGNRYGISKGAQAPNSKTIGIFEAGWIRDVIQTGVEAGRKCWPKGMWFHAHGFGANSKTAWNQLWNVLEKDGFELKPAPPSLAVARLRNTLVGYFRRQYEYFTQSEEAMFQNFSELGREIPELSLKEFEGIYAAF